METSRKMRVGMMAATSLLAASAALAPAHASDFDAAAYPATIEAPAAPDIGHAVDHADQKGATAGKRLALIAVAGGVLALLVKLIGARKVMRAVRKSAGEAARVAAVAAAGTAKAAGRVLRSPLRYLAWVAGLTFFALAGVELYDIKWAGGLVAGAALAGAIAFGMWKIRMAVRPIGIKPDMRRTRQTEINQ